MQESFITAVANKRIALSEIRRKLNRNFLEAGQSHEREWRSPV